MGQTECKPCDCTNLLKGIAEVNISALLKAKDDIASDRPLHKVHSKRKPGKSFHTSSLIDVRFSAQAEIIQAWWRGIRVRRRIAIISRQFSSSPVYFTYNEIMETLTRRPLSRRRRKEKPFTYKNNAIYIGEWKGGFRDGHGIMVWPDGSRYEGK